MNIKIDDDFDDEDDADLASDDYLFIVDKEGNLKSILLPDDYTNESVPDTISAILSIFGISGFDEEKPTLH